MNRLRKVVAIGFMSMLLLSTGGNVIVSAQDSKPQIKKKIKKAKKVKKVRKRVRKKVNKNKKAARKVIKYKKKTAKKKKSLRRSLQTWLKKMKKRVARSHAKRNQIVSVAAVRGNETPDSPPLYWKGKKSEGPVDLPELEDFDRAINTAIKGNSGVAVTKLENFIKKYPNSVLVKDANHTLGMLREAQPQ